MRMRSGQWSGYQRRLRPRGTQLVKLNRYKSVPCGRGSASPVAMKGGGKWARTSPAAATTRDQLQAVHTAVDTTLDRLAGSEQSQGRRRREKQNGLRSVLVLSLGAAANFDIGDKNEILTGLSARPCTSTWMATGVSGGRDLGGELGSYKPTTRRWGSTSLVRSVRTQLRARC